MFSTVFAPSSPPISRNSSRKTVTHVRYIFFFIEPSLLFLPSMKIPVSIFWRTDSYRTTAGEAYGYNERHGSSGKSKPLVLTHGLHESILNLFYSDATSSRALPPNLPAPVTGKNYSSATFSPTYEYLANNNLRPYTDKGNVSYPAQQDFPYNQRGAVTQQNFTSATFPATEKFAAKEMQYYDMRSSPSSNNADQRRYNFDLYKSATAASPSGQSVALSSSVIRQAATGDQCICFLALSLSDPLCSLTVSPLRGTNSATLQVAGSQTVRGIAVPQ